MLKMVIGVASLVAVASAATLSLMGRTEEVAGGWWIAHQCDGFPLDQIFTAARIGELPECKEYLREGDPRNYVVSVGYDLPGLRTAARRLEESGKCSEVVSRGDGLYQLEAVTC